MMARTVDRLRTPRPGRVTFILAGIALVLVALIVAQQLGVGGQRGGSDDSVAGSAGGGTTALGASEEGAAVAPDGAFMGRDLDAGSLSQGPQSMPSGGSAEEAGAPAPGGGGDGAPSQVDFLGRTIIRSGSVDLQVESVSGAFEQVRQVAQGHGGFVADSTFYGQEERQQASMTIRVPAESFGEVVLALQEMAVEVNSISTSAQDVTEEFQDLQATLRNLRAVESQYLDLLGRAESIGDVLQVQDRLSQVRLQIERTQGRIQLLESQSDMASVSVSLRPVGEEATVAEAGGGPLQAARDAWQASLDTLEGIATVAVVAVVYSWWLVPVAIVLLVIVRRAMRADRAAAPAAPAGPAE
ncbi:MAG: DUF4349 domain-containing protein [Dehalococcoidia bacterium]|nr:DUF4349 domain-containing protein [Dehalococcoidia bacterium]